MLNGSSLKKTKKTKLEHKGRSLNKNDLENYIKTEHVVHYIS